MSKCKERNCTSRDGHLLAQQQQQQRRLSVVVEWSSFVGGVVDEVAAWSVRTQSAARVVGAAQVSLVLGVARDRPQLGDAVRKLTTLGVPALRHTQREREREREIL